MAKLTRDSVFSAATSGQAQRPAAKTTSTHSGHAHSHGTTKQRDPNKQVGQKSYEGQDTEPLHTIIVKGQPFHAGFYVGDIVRSGFATERTKITAYNFIRAMLMAGQSSSPIGKVNLPKYKDDGSYSDEEIALFNEAQEKIKDFLYNDFLFGLEEAKKELDDKNKRDGTKKVYKEWDKIVKLPNTLMGYFSSAINLLLTDETGASAKKNPNYRMDFIEYLKERHKEGHLPQIKSFPVDNERIHNALRQYAAKTLPAFVGPDGKLTSADIQKNVLDGKIITHFLGSQAPRNIKGYFGI